MPSDPKYRQRESLIEVKVTYGRQKSMLMSGKITKKIHENCTEKLSKTDLLHVRENYQKIHENCIEKLSKTDLLQVATLTLIVQKTGTRFKSDKLCFSDIVLYRRRVKGCCFIGNSMGNR